MWEWCDKYTLLDLLPNLSTVGICYVKVGIMAVCLCVCVRDSDALGMCPCMGMWLPDSESWHQTAGISAGIITWCHWPIVNSSAVTPLRTRSTNHRSVHQTMTPGLRMWNAIGVAHGDHRHGNLWRVVEGVSSQRILFIFLLDCFAKCFAYWSSSNTLKVFLSVSSLMALERSGLNTVIMTQITSTQGFWMFGQLHKICPLLMLWSYTTRNHQQKDNRAMSDQNNQHL